MKIACLEWGSLVWDPRSLHVRSEWFADGPLLPIEFARESKDKRVTLVITPGSPPLRSLWALSSLDSVDAAKADLALREEIKDKNVQYSIDENPCVRLRHVQLLVRSRRERSVPTAVIP
jgi:hypothetical protein